MDSIETFEDYLKTELGNDTVRNIKSHFLITCSQLKPAMDYIFSNLYSEKSSKIVDLNLKLDEVNKPIDSGCRNNDSVRIKNRELKKKLNDLKANYAHTQMELNCLKKTVEASQKKLNETKKCLLNKQVKSVSQKSQLKLAQEISQTVEKSSHIFDFIKENSIQNGFDLSNGEAHNLVKKNLEESLNNVCNLIDQDSKLIEQSVNSFQTDLELISYRINSSAQLASLDQPNAEIFDNVNEINFDLLNKASHILKYREETQRFSTTKNQIKNKFIGYLKENYSSNNISLYGQYLKNFLMCKSVESNLNEIVTFLKYLEDETNVLLAKNSSRTNFTQLFLNDLKSSIQMKHLKINDLFRENLFKVVSSFQNSQAQLKTKLDFLFSLVVSFNMEFLNKLDYSFSSPTSNLLASSSFKTNSKQVEIYKQDEDDMVLSKCFNSELFSKNTNVASKLLLFNKFVTWYYETKKLMHDYEKTHKLTSRMSLLKEATASLEQTLLKVKSNDSRIQSKYGDLLREKANKISSLESNLDEIEKLKETWITQPAVSQCVFDSLTVLGKDISYYANIIEENVANHKRTWLNHKHLDIS